MYSYKIICNQIIFISSSDMKRLIEDLLKSLFLKAVNEEEGYTKKCCLEFKDIA